jgi:hypothetical protein
MAAFATTNVLLFYHFTKNTERHSNRHTHYTAQQTQKGNSGSRGRLPVITQLF